LSLVGDARFVLLGEASHGTHEFYHERIRITRRLIEEKGFAAIAVEADWAEADPINRYVRDADGVAAAEEALSSFNSFPLWMWGNTDVLDMVRWLRQHNDSSPAGGQQIGFYGLDFFNREKSADLVIRYLEGLDKEAANRARDRYTCVRPVTSDSVNAESKLPVSEADCDKAVLEQLQELEQMYKASVGSADSNSTHQEALFSAVQSAHAIKGNREYDRAPSRGSSSSWNVRDRHMADTLDALSTHLQRSSKLGKVVVWAHNSHVGDMSATDFGRDGEWSLGQLMRERHKGDAVLVGFSTYAGEVMAATEWDTPGKVQPVPEAKPDSYPGLFHEALPGDFLLILRGNTALAESLDEPRPERGIGVVYNSDMEGITNYSGSWLSKQFDAVIHIDRTTAVTLLKP
jgi:erythromycin esterase-like protein